jgi:hypothetical protein
MQFGGEMISAVEVEKNTFSTRMWQEMICWFNSWDQKYWLLFQN